MDPPAPAPPLPPSPAPMLQAGAGTSGQYMRCLWCSVDVGVGRRGYWYQKTTITMVVNPSILNTPSQPNGYYQGIPPSPHTARTLRGIRGAMAACTTARATPCARSPRASSCSPRPPQRGPASSMCSTLIASSCPFGCDSWVDDQSNPPSQTAISVQPHAQSAPLSELYDIRIPSHACIHPPIQNTYLNTRRPAAAHAPRRR